MVFKFNNAGFNTQFYSFPPGPGQGYADKRKRKFINKYQKLKRKHRLESEKGNASTSDRTDIALFSKDTVDETHEVKSALRTETTIPVHDGPETVEEKHDHEKRKERGAGGEVPKDTKRYKRRGGKKNSGKNRFSKAQEEFGEKRKAEQMRLEVDSLLVPSLLRMYDICSVCNNCSSDKH